MKRALTLILFFAAGCGPPWAIIVQSGPPSAAAGAPQITYAADFQQLIMDGQPIGNILAAESPNEQASIQQAFAEMDQEFFSQLSSRVNIPITPAQGPPQQNEVRLTGIYSQIQRGARGPVGSASVVVMRYSVSVNGQVVDEVEMSRSLAPSLTRSSRARRLKWCAGQLGSYAARFINQIQGGGA